MIELRRYQLENERIPFTEWLSTLRDVRARAQIEIRLRRVAEDGYSARQGLLG